MSDRSLLFYFDYLSHNAYLAWSVIKPLCEEHQLRLEPVPVLFAGLLRANEQKGPAEVEPKREWMTRDVVRKAALLGLPFQPPASHPFNPLLPLRLTLAANNDPVLIDRLFQATWAESRAVNHPEVLTALLEDMGLPVETLFQGMATDEIKQMLRDNTEAAARRGVFGVPGFGIDEMLFWGYDDIPMLRLYLEGKDPLQNVDLAPWLSVPSSAVR